MRGPMLGLLALVVAPVRLVAQEVSPCQACHQAIVASFLETAHFRTSAEATPHTVKGRFAEGHNLLRTSSESVYFRMERRGGVSYQTGIDLRRGISITKRIDIVVGSGRRGQSYLYWSRGLLFELPVSYLSGVDRWINSPGYADGEIDFGRIIVPRCLECHSTSFVLQTDRGVTRYSRGYVLGIACDKCHGDSRAHVRYQSSHPGDSSARYIVDPANLSRDRKVDGCALCYSGERVPLVSPFSYRPGEKLDAYFMPEGEGSAVPDVHGNQVGLLRRSKCFRSSPEMSCATCHNVHQQQRDLAWFAQKCVGCHQTREHPMGDQIGDRLMTDCIDCHMPNRQSKAIQINTPTKPFVLYFRSHAIGIYPAVARAVLRSNAEKPNR